MPGVGEEAPGVGEHADEPGEQPGVCQGLHHLHHAVLVVGEPPGGAQLHLLGEGPLLEGPQDAGQLVVVAGVQGVDHRGGQLVRLVQRVEQGGHGGGADPVSHAVKAGVRPGAGEHPGVGVAQHPKVELHHKAHFFVEPPQAQKQLGLVGVLFGGGEGLPGEGFDKSGLRLLPGACGKVRGLQALVGDEAASLFKIESPLGKGLFQIAERSDGLAGDLPQTAYPVPEVCLLRVQGGLRTEGGEHLYREAAVGGQGGVVL